MNWDRVEGNWTELKGKVQQKWGKLTNDDLEVVKGQAKPSFLDASSSAMAMPRIKPSVKSIRG